MITSPITWPATAVVVHVGATPVFVDVHDPTSTSTHRGRQAVTPRTKAILPVDLAGQPADLDPLLELGVPVIEDAAHAVGAEYRGRPIGSIAAAVLLPLRDEERHLG